MPPLRKGLSGAAQLGGAPADVGAVEDGGCDAGGRAGRPAEILGVDDPRPRDARVLKLTSARGTGDPLEWLPLTGFSDKSWSRRVQSRIAAALTSTAAGVPAALGLNNTQLTIVKDCMHSLATSRD